MSKSCWPLAIAWLSFCACFLDSARASRTIAPPNSPYIAEVWDLGDDLPGSSVFSVIQTRDGYLWFGTLYGLVRFDGMNFTTFDEANTPGLNSSRIIHLFEDSHTNLWVGTESAGLSMIQPSGQIQSFEAGRGSSNGRIIASCEDSDTIWFLMANGQVFRYQHKQLSLFGTGYRAVMSEKDGPLWFGSGKGLVAFNRTNASPSLEATIGVTQRLDFLLASAKGGYWRLADGRIQKWKGNRQEQDLGPYPWNNAPVLAGCEDREGNLIVGTYGDGVYWFDAEGKFSRLELSHSFILSVAMDREGSLWVGTDGGGLNRVKRKMFGVLGNSEARTVQSVCQDREGGLWIGYNGNRVEHWKDGAGQEFTVATDPKVAQYTYIRSVFVDHEGKVRVGVWSSVGPRLYEFQDGKFQPVTPGIHQDISAIYEDRSSRLWLGLKGGLALWDGGRPKIMPLGDVRAIADDAEGNLWVGTGNGLMRLHDGQVGVIQKKNGVPSDDISCLLSDSDGVLWIGTRGSGLARFHKGKWTHYTTAHGLSGNSIGYLIEDGDGGLWIGSNVGLTRVSKKSLTDVANGTSGTFESRAYTEADGLGTRECTQGSQPAACRTADGMLCFPTARGLVSVNPTALHPSAFHPPVIIEAALIGQEQKTNRLHSAPLPTLVIPPGKERLEIHYTSLNLGAGARSRFRYHLRGHDLVTNDVGNARIARYPKLPPGNYVFEVNSSNEDGVWNPTPATLAIIVQPPFWKTWWFITIVSVTLLGNIIALVYFVSTQKLQRQVATLKQQEALERERGRIARDLHDQLGANLTQVALLGEMAETDKNVPEEVEDHARQISQTARETTRALDEIVWAVNPSNDTLDSLVTYACKYAQEYFELAGLRYRVDVPSQLPNTGIAPEVRHNVFLAFKEAVNNVVKHAQATEARIRLRLQSDTFELEIEDNGRGVPAEADKFGRNGLKNMRKRMQEVDGGFAISPAAGQGTVVRLTVPIANS